MSRVVNMKWEKVWDVRVDRGSKWGNPFVMDYERQRGEVIEKFRQWLWKEMKRGGYSLEEVASLDGKVLACWCAPLPCHGDVLVAAAKWAKERV